MLPEATRDSILGADDRRPVPVDVPEWGVTVYVQAITAWDRHVLDEEIFAASKSATKDYAVVPSFLARAICDSAGRPLFTAADVKALGAKSAGALARLYEQAAPLSRLNVTPEAAEKN